MENSLQDTKLVQLLRRRSVKCQISAALYGAIHPIVSDITPFLEYIKRSFPSYTDHGIKHSTRIIQRISAIMTQKAMQELSSCEIFALILAALFHDTGMVASESTIDNNDAIRAVHHQRSRQIVVDYFESKLTLISSRRLAEVIGFVVESHGLDWATMTGREEFVLKERVFEQVVRTPILAIMLRIGDLLDLDSDRTNSLCLDKCRNWINVPGSLDHHERHQCVRSFYYDSRGIKLRVQCEQRRQHQLWEQWVSYLRQDIELANTYIFRDDLAIFQLPAPDLRVERSPNAAYELWPLRFEIDNDGALWEILRQSIYTGRLDFIREVIQNAMDAVLRRLYDKNSSKLVSHSPRSWSNASFQPSIIVAYVHSEKRLIVIDNGIGMARHDLENFLFRVAKSGVQGVRNDRDFPFPSIAMFGVGFTSVLTRARQVTITTRKADGQGTEDALQVQLSSAQREAYLERQSGWPEGTCVLLDLGFALKPREINYYLLDNMNYTSVPIYFLDVDELKNYIDSVEQLRHAQGISAPVISFSDLIHYLLNGEAPRAVKEIDVFISESSRQARGLTTRRIAGSVVAALAQHVFDQSSPLEKIGGNAILPPPIEEALFISLQENFSTQKICNKHPGKHLTFAEARLGILFVPVQFSDYNKGIEWSSMHAFVVENGSIRRVVAVVRARGKSFIFGSNDLRFDEDIEWSEREIEELSVGWDRFTASTQGVQEQRLLIAEPMRIGFSRYLSLSEDKVFDLTKEFPEVSRDFRFEFDGKKVSAVALNAMEWFSEKRGEVYQDGIRLPIDIRSLACVGVTAGTVNLTAAARFRLNIARNAIDRTPSFLANWRQATGRLICEQIAGAVRDAIESFGLIFDWNSLWMEVASDFSLETKSEWGGLRAPGMQQKRLSTPTASTI